MTAPLPSCRLADNVLNFPGDGPAGHEVPPSAGGDGGGGDRSAFGDIIRQVRHVSTLHRQIERISEAPELSPFLGSRQDEASAPYAGLTESEALALLNLLVCGLRSGAVRSLATCEAPVASLLLAETDRLVQAASDLTAVFREHASQGRLGILEFDVEEYAEMAVHYQGRRQDFGARLADSRALIDRLADLPSGA